MKRCLAWIMMIALICVLVPASAQADTQQGEMLITSDPVEGAVNEIVSVDFYCYPNLPEGTGMDSLEFTLEYDPSVLTFGSINYRVEDQNLDSILNSKSPLKMVNTNEAGKLIFAWIDAEGTDAQGFLFQIEFRIEKEGATSFVFNSVRYSCVESSSYKPAGSFFINPLSVGGVKTPDQEIPDDGAADATYAPLEPAVETPAPQPTATPKPSNGGQTVPKTSTLPEPSNKPSSDPTGGVVTPKPAVTSMPMRTPSASQKATEAPATEAPATDVPATDAPQTDAPQTDTPANPDATAETNPVAEVTETPIPVAEVTPEPDRQNEQTNPTPEPEPVNPAPQQPNRALVIAVIAGIIVVILLAILAIVLILIHNKRQRSEE